MWVDSTEEDIRAQQGPGQSAEENFRSINLVIFILHRIFRCLIQEDKMGGACGCYGEKKNVHTDFAGKPEVKKPH
jgi:hypothetical protein